MSIKYQLLIFGGYFSILMLFLLLKSETLFEKKIVHFLDKISDIRGVSSRKSYLVKTVLPFIVTVIIGFFIYYFYDFLSSIDKNNTYFKVPLLLVFFTTLLIGIPIIVICVSLQLFVLIQRLHDIGHSGWWYAVAITVGLVTEILSISLDFGVIGIAIGLILTVFWLGLFFVPSKIEGNKYRSLT